MHQFDPDKYQAIKAIVKSDTNKLKDKMNRNNRGFHMQQKEFAATLKSQQSQLDYLKNDTGDLEDELNSLHTLVSKLVERSKQQEVMIVKLQQQLSNERPLYITSVPKGKLVDSKKKPEEFPKILPSGKPNPRYESTTPKLTKVKLNEPPHLLPDGTDMSGMSKMEVKKLQSGFSVDSDEYKVAGRYATYLTMKSMN